MAEATPFIRPYDPTKDRDAMIHIFRKTAGPDLVAGGDEVLHLASYNWCRPYLLLQPQNCFVLDDGTSDGKAVGYIIGTADTKEFVRQWRETYIPYLDAEGVHKPKAGESVDWEGNLGNALRDIAHGPEGLLQGYAPLLVEGFPAHLHVDILEGYRRGGYGKMLVERFCEHVAGLGAGGVHLGMEANNLDAGLFYDRIGFERYPEVIDGGKSGEVGRRGHSVMRVKKLC